MILTNIMLAKKVRDAYVHQSSHVETIVIIVGDNYGYMRS